MKKVFQHIIILLFISNATFAQVLYSEDFDNFNTGDLGFINPSTNWGNYGVNLVPGQDDWYAAENMWYSSAPNFTVRIVPESGRGNVLEIKDIPIDSMPGAPNGLLLGVNVFKKELNLPWDQRTTGNDILKIDYELCIPNDKIFKFHTAFTVRQKNPKIHFDFGMADYIANIAERGHYDSLELSGKNYAVAPIERTIPISIWVNFAIYVDYTTGYVYVEIPTLNHAVRSILPNPTLVNNTDDGMVDAIILGAVSDVIRSGSPNIVKFDNIKISAVNTLPKLSVNELLSSKFAVFPNPVTDIVTITGSENIGVEQIEVFDVSGKTVKSRNYAMENEVQLNIGDMANGMYLLHIKTNEGVAVKKVVKK